MVRVSVRWQCDQSNHTRQHWTGHREVLYSAINTTDNRSTARTRHLHYPASSRGLSASPQSTYCLPLCPRPSFPSQLQCSEMPLICWSSGLHLRWLSHCGPQVPSLWVL